jgi:starch synthase (maltosyl-transferring)
MTKLVMAPTTGERLLRFVGDRLHFSLTLDQGRALPAGWRALLRTNLGRARAIREVLVSTHFHRRQLAGASWQDLPMQVSDGQWSLDLALSEVGYFRAKSYAVDPVGRQHWPGGPDSGVTVHPDSYRTANTIYCAFIRLFGETKTAVTTRNEKLESQLKALDKQGYTVIPASGKIRDLIQQLPHIIDALGCRIVHLLPVNPTPTTYARMGRFGSPYACQDLTAIDPALVEFDRRTTGIDQFRELTYAAHLRGAKVFLDLVINHTGWSSTLHELHPEWFLHGPDGAFLSPGAWGVTWEDLVELDHRIPLSWEHLAGAFLIWCRRGVDGFRCDAGYKVPAAAWQFIIARVRQEFPDTIFFLEGLGGAWEVTENLLTEGGMQWAYSELFQNVSGVQVGGYLAHSLLQSQRVGVLVHYSETHDNPRLAAKGRAWSLLRNRLCALTSGSGAFGFTCGVEWLATEKILVHGCSGLAWDSADNLVADLRQLNQLLAGHPCFFDGAVCTQLSALDSPVLALRRDSADGAESVLVLVNTDIERAHTLALAGKHYLDVGQPVLDLLETAELEPLHTQDGNVIFALGPGACYCLGATAKTKGLRGDVYRETRARSAWALTAVSQVLPVEDIGAYDWRRLADLVNENPAAFLAALERIDRAAARVDLHSALQRALAGKHYPGVVVWRRPDRRRVTLVPPAHWLLVEDQTGFRATLDGRAGSYPQRVTSIKVSGGYAACFPPNQNAGDAQLTLERYASEDPHVEATIRFLAPEPLIHADWNPEPGTRTPELSPLSAPLILLTNGIGGMARIGIDLGSVKSKYDCLLGANLHTAVPVDRHIFAKRVRAWVNADGFITQLTAKNLVAFEPGPPALWRFVAGAGDGRAIEIQLVADMLAGCNTTVLRFTRPQHPPPLGKDLPEDRDVRLTVRIDIEDRNFHTETKRNGWADQYFTSHCHPLKDKVGFTFTPAPDRQLRVFSYAGQYFHEAEWSENIPHPLEQSRGQIGSGDAYSPGWFDLPTPKGASVVVVVTAEAVDPEPASVLNFVEHRRAQNELAIKPAALSAPDEFGRLLALGAQAFVVRRDQAKTVIAGYPWFLDWGRDSLICARGLLAAGMEEEVRQLLVTFGRFEEKGTLPNSIHGEDASNRDTSDAPLWYGVVCEEVAAILGQGLYEVPVDRGGRAIGDVLRDIALGYLRGTPNGIRMDAASALIWSPPHFTWMDTNYPAATPREGYPVEIQALWIRLLRQLNRIGMRPQGEPWQSLAARSEKSLNDRFWLKDRGYFADRLIARAPEPAAHAAVDPALRSNFLLAISLGLLRGERARRAVSAAGCHLLVPGAVRTLAPLPVTVPLPVHGSNGQLLNHPLEPYWGRYEGDEDTRRKLAYHNGTAWVWSLAVFCEALARAWNFEPAAIAAARACLGSVDRLLASGCLNQLPEIVDGDAPHFQRGCDAQAWSVTEVLRVWKLLTPPKESKSVKSED